MRRAGRRRGDGIALLLENRLPRHPTGKPCKRLLKDRDRKGHATRIV